jgi:hypothetical protein
MRQLGVDIGARVGSLLTRNARHIPAPSRLTNSSSRALQTAVLGFVHPDILTMQASN